MSLNVSVTAGAVLAAGVVALNLGALISSSYKYRSLGGAMLALGCVCVGFSFALWGAVRVFELPGFLRDVASMAAVGGFALQFAAPLLPRAVYDYERRK